MNKKAKNVFKRAIQTFGILKQSLKWCEELSELQKEISKAGWGENNRKELIDEIADVKVITMQICLLMVSEQVR